MPDVKKNQLIASSIVIQTLTEEEWKKFIDPTVSQIQSNPMADTALRRTKVGSVMRYGYEIYNAKLDPSKLPQLTTKIRVFHDGKIILDGQQTPFDLRGQTDMEHLKTAGAISIGDKMPPGDYISGHRHRPARQGTKTADRDAGCQFEVVPQRLDYGFAFSAAQLLPKFAKHDQGFRSIELIRWNLPLVHF